MEIHTEPDSQVVQPRFDSPHGGRSHVIIAAIIIAAAILVSGWTTKRSHTVSFDKPYQAVLLTNGQVYYGRLEGWGTDSPILREVYYVQTSTNPQTKESTNILMKRGREWHAPDRMYLNPSQVLLVETVGTDSKVADLIRELKAQAN